jgi:hypothetical protein
VRGLPLVGTGPPVPIRSTQLPHKQNSPRPLCLCGERRTFFSPDTAPFALNDPALSSLSSAPFASRCSESGPNPASAARDLLFSCWSVVWIFRVRYDLRSAGALPAFSVLQTEFTHNFIVRNSFAARNRGTSAIQCRRCLWRNRILFCSR